MHNSLIAAFHFVHHVPFDNSSLPCAQVSCNNSNLSRYLVVDLDDPTSITRPIRGCCNGFKNQPLLRDLHAGITKEGAFFQAPTLPSHFWVPLLPFCFKCFLLASSSFLAKEN
jgi:hypothetical protein